MQDSGTKGSARILIADDSSSIRSNLKKILESRPNRWKVCAEAVNGVAAVQMAVRSKPDLIILDFQMPSMDGLTASGRISKSLPAVPILMFTIHKSEYIELEARKAGVHTVISKSDPAGLLRVVKALLSE